MKIGIKINYLQKSADIERKKSENCRKLRFNSKC